MLDRLGAGEQPGHLELQPFLQLHPGHHVTQGPAISARLLRCRLQGRAAPYSAHTLTVSPDGGTIFFTQIERSESDIMLLELRSLDAQIW